MRITLTDGQVKEIWRGLSKDKMVELLATDVNRSVDAIDEFIYLHVHQRWLQADILATLKATPVQRELFPEQNIP